MAESNLRKLVVWQKARRLAVNVYRVTRGFPREEIFGLVSQMRRACVSILSTIAEGQGRWSRPDYHRFLITARGSALELEAQIVISEDLQYMATNDAQALLDGTAEVTRMLNGLIKHVRSEDDR